MEANYKEQFRIKKRRVYCTTTAAISAGFAVVYDYDDGTATTEDLARAKKVKSPGNGAKYFAGVLLSDKPAGARWIDIAVPGSDCYAYLGDSSATILDVVTASGIAATAGEFVSNSDTAGCGAAVVLKTVTAEGLVHVKLLEGSDIALATT